MGVAQGVKKNYVSLLSEIRFLPQSTSLIWNLPIPRGAVVHALYSTCVYMSMKCYNYWVPYPGAIRLHTQHSDHHHNSSSSPPPTLGKDFFINYKL